MTWNFLFFYLSSVSFLFCFGGITNENKYLSIFPRKKEQLRIPSNEVLMKRLGHHATPQDEGET